MKKGEALIELFREARSPRLSKTGYRRIVKAMDVLQIPEDERAPVLRYMEYADLDGNVRDEYKG